jgi:chitinase
MSDSDSDNFLLLLQELKKAPEGKNLILSAAVSLSPFAGSDGAPMRNVSAFAKVLDFIEIMVYDITGSFQDTPGPNAPLNDTCSPVKTGSAVSAVNAWTSASFPVNQIVLGVASYGHASIFPPSSAHAFKSSDNRASCSAFTQYTGWDGEQGKDSCGYPVPSGGIWNFNALVSGGYLDDHGNAKEGVDYRYDDCSQTPYVYAAATQTMVTYDDAKSFAVKGNFIKNHGLKGFAMWESAADYGDILLDSITSASKC